MSPGLFPEHNYILYNQLPIDSRNVNPLFMNMYVGEYL